MKKYLAILLLLVLPVQSAWAAVDSFCKHETGAAAEHLGHHDHQHKYEGTEPAATDSSSGSTGANADYDHCHGGTSSVLSATLSVTAHRAATPSSHSLGDLLPPPLADRPERPQWHHLA